MTTVPQSIDPPTSATRAQITNAGRQMREWEQGLITIITAAADVSEAIDWSGYTYADIKVMAERYGVRL
jgi:hypothetical protein